MSKTSSVHHFEYSEEEKTYMKKSSSNHVSKQSIKTNFITIERIAISCDNSIFVIIGFSVDEGKKEVTKYEVYDMDKKTVIAHHRLAKKPNSLCFLSEDSNTKEYQKSSTFAILLKDSMMVCSEEQEWKAVNVSLPVGPTTKYIAMVSSDEGCLFILSEDKQLLKIENEKEITDVYDLEESVESIPTTITASNSKICIGCLNGLMYVSSVENPLDLYVQPMPPYLGLGAAEEVEFKEYPDTIVTVMNQDTVVSVYSDKTMVVFQNSKINHIVQNHAKAIYNIDTIPKECSEKGF